ncbi:hypothetical protein MTR62_03030 [Novosphingobium sp. 1949]|uniref:Secreted protein n=1 Tax=Novosphingobium organovorum TaxID=2930092 RepID=A0ABT0B9D8_9SPHN|nr:hypothetical protein [Novosphingobium organovorum]MCJ2181685.1 hypothetical protein [Novosphingobium organovorum]
MSRIHKRQGARAGISLKTMSMHFAVVTLAVTAGLAMFADDERTPDVGGGAAIAQASTTARPDAISRAVHGESANSIVNRTNETPGSFGPDEGPSAASANYGYAQSAGAGYEMGSTLPPGLSPYALPTSLPPGMTLEQWLALKENMGEMQTAGLPQVVLSAADVQTLNANGASQPPAPSSH